MADVTIKLTGVQYRNLVMENEYHERALKAEHDKLPNGADKRAAMERHAKFADVAEAVRR